MRRMLVALSTAAALALTGTGAAHAQDLPAEMTYGSQGMDRLSSDNASDAQTTEGVQLLSADYAIGSSGFFLVGLILYHVGALLPQDVKIPLSTA